MAEEKRTGKERRFGSGTRSNEPRRKNKSDDWDYYEKRQGDDRRKEDRLVKSDRRDSDSH